MSAILSQPHIAQARRPGIITGIAISLAFHGLLIFGYRLTIPPAQPAAGQASTTLTVWLRPPKPPVPPEPLVKVDIPPKPVAPRKRDKTDVAHTASQPVAAVAATAASAPEVQAQAITLPPQPGADPLHPENDPKKFDINAALKTARKAGIDKDPARAGTAVAQLDDHPLYPEQHETQLARGVAGAKRGDCKNTPGGLLAPLIWLMDKKDHGCKW